MFTCYDMYNKWGVYNFDGALLERWEKPKELKRTWMMACMSNMYNNRHKFSWKPGMIDYKKSKDYKENYQLDSTHINNVRLSQATRLREQILAKKKLALEQKQKE